MDTHASSFCKGIALAVEAFRAELEGLRGLAPEAEVYHGCALIRRSLCELQLLYGERQLESGQHSGAAIFDGLPTECPRAECLDVARSPPVAGDDYADASVDEAGPHVAADRFTARRLSVQQVLEVLDRRNPTAMMVELRATQGIRTFDVQRDVASLVCCRSAAALAIRLWWPSIVLGILGTGVPFSVIYTLHWANGGLGQFALAYTWPLWLEVWICLGFWLFVCVLLLWYASMQRDLAWMALKQLSTLWIIAMTGIFVAGLISLYEFGIHRSTWINLPLYVALALYFPLVTMADALPPGLRLPVLRFAGPFALGCMAAVSLVLRLPTAEGTPGKLVWTVMGTDTVTNLQALTYSSSVMTVLLAKGVLRAWAFPNQLAFVQTSLCVAELASDEPHVARPVAVALQLDHNDHSELTQADSDDEIALS